ncbi:hypothetical protein BS50DRAFT_396470 [Corynespora cassiicola Philippines]|uniref:Extracellular membrane protein CFEM domain-containing protein n=1 Tax=Corynespora cassiicola Philippines TaxID=1448308 RepID=A0A2T2NJU4_CORCC|nr:hypothetical protein BS50DRAFT_396470 [Corynespora cassiicola Philippines]
MHKALVCAIMAGLMASGLTRAEGSVSLSNFTPRIENLPSQCQAVYTTPIDGCQSKDFTGQTSSCSSPCITGLIKISKSINEQCKSVDVPETSIIGVFLLGQGIQALCPGITVTTISSAASTQQQTSTPTPPSSSSSPEASSTPQSIQIDTTIASSTLATSATSTPSAPPAPPASSAPTPDQPAALSSSAPDPQDTGSSQVSNADSGGGSPFDVVATGASPPTQRRDALLAVVVGALLLLCTAM